MDKTFRLSAEDIQPLATDYGACIATDMIVVDGYPVRFMYREEPETDEDSGWRFMSGFEDDDYMEDASRHGVYDVNIIANYSPDIIPLLDAPAGSAFEKTPQGERFVEVDDWEGADEDDDED